MTNPTTDHDGQGREALALLRLVRRYKEWAAHRGDDEAASQWRAVEGALKAHDAEVAAAAWDEGFYATAPSYLGGRKFTPSPRNPYRADESNPR